MPFPLFAGAFQAIIRESKMRGKDSEHAFGDKGQLILSVLFVVVWVGDSFSLRISTFLSDLVLLSVRLIILGLALALGAFLVVSGHGVINHGRHPTGVISSGAYRFVRHPLYLGCILFYLGLSVATASLFSLGLLALIFLFYNYIATYEEKWLESRFGESYRSYKKRTGKWLPNLP
jgi:protein-S-isoprenylcysteine O-methyltransferase Ste14